MILCDIKSINHKIVTITITIIITVIITVLAAEVLLSILSLLLRNIPLLFYSCGMSFRLLLKGRFLLSIWLCFITSLFFTRVGDN